MEESPYTILPSKSFFSLFDPTLLSFSPFCLISAISCAFQLLIDSQTLLSILFLALYWSKPFFRSLFVLSLPDLQTSKVLEMVALSQLILCLLMVFLIHINQYFVSGSFSWVGNWSHSEWYFGGHVQIFTRVLILLDLSAEFDTTDHWILLLGYGYWNRYHCLCILVLNLFFYFSLFYSVSVLQIFPIW